MMLGNTTSRCQALADKYGEAARSSYWVLAVADLARLASELLTRPESAPRTATLLAQWANRGLRLSPAPHALIS
jgi:hypothetical protein